jgi:hypothetical protein
MSALPPKADIVQRDRRVCFVLAASIPSRPGGDGVVHAPTACTMPPHLHDRADPDIPHEPCTPPTRNRVLSVTWYVQGRPLRTAVKLRAASSRAVTVPPPLADPKYAGTADADETANAAAATNPR